jgi:hypothetical protein
MIYSPCAIAEVLYAVFVAITYGSGLPVLYLIATLSLFVRFYMDKAACKCCCVRAAAAHSLRVTNLVPVLAL